MRSIISFTPLLIYILLCAQFADATAFGRRQVGSSTFPSTSSVAAPSTTASQSTRLPTIHSTSPTNVGPGSSDAAPSVSQSAITTLLSLNSTSLNTISHSVAATTISKTSTSSTTAVSTATNGTATTHSNSLPLKPKITPGLSITGIVLMVSGLAFLLIGIKNRSIQ